MANTPRATARGVASASSPTQVSSGGIGAWRADTIRPAYDPLKYPALLEWTPEDVHRERAHFHGTIVRQLADETGRLVSSPLPYTDFDVFLGLLQAAMPEEKVSVIVEGYSLLHGGEGERPFYEANAYVVVQRQGTDHELIRVKASGATGGDAAHRARWWAVRTLLFGDVMLTGVLIDQPRAWARLDLVDPKQRMYLLSAKLYEQDGGGEPITFQAKVKHDRASGLARASYQRVWKDTIPSAARERLASELDFRPTLRLHRLILAMGGQRVIDRHGHHQTHVSNDARFVSLSALQPDHHARQHGEFFDHPDGTGDYLGWDRFLFGEFSIYKTAAEWPTLWTYDAYGRHIGPILRRREIERILGALEKASATQFRPVSWKSVVMPSSNDFDARVILRDQTPKKVRPVGTVADDEWLTPRQVAAHLGLHEDTVRRRLRAGLLPGKPLGKQWRVSAQELAVFMQSQAK